MSKANRISLAIMRSPLLWGLLASVAFFAPIQTGRWKDEFVLRYFAGHWVEYVETAMFFVGLAGLILKAFDIVRQSAGLSRVALPPPAAAPLPPSEAESMLASLDSLPENQRDDYLPRRLREALQSVRFAGSADKLGDELKYLSESDASRSHASYAMLRIIIWAIPILGFLGTVIGITMAIASLNPQALEDSLPMVTGGLGTAFDTTALALGLSMVLMFTQFFVDRMESGLLSAVDVRAADELSGRFEQMGAIDDPQVAAVRRIADAVIRSTEALVERQAEVWQRSIDAAQQRWSELAAASGKQLEGALSGALSQSIAAHAERLAASAEASAEQNRRNWSRLQQALADSTEKAKVQQTELTRQGDILLRVVEATGHVTKLQDALNGNLASLAGAQHFEETVLNLAAAIHLLNARLGQVSSTPQIDLKESSSVGRAA
ncbi:MAG TPA: MotA/TolQ/ExbB proton channel family protein [Pirellulales bacterium]|nr:MotA/TolQ/ExbB proton channel family protein [Pirellulales bacterium]